jgi:hypothetical protein
MAAMFTRNKFIGWYERSERPGEDTANRVAGRPWSLQFRAGWGRVRTRRGPAASLLTSRWGCLVSDGISRPGHGNANVGWLVMALGVVSLLREDAHVCDD